jgi:protein TonB
MTFDDVAPDIGVSGGPSGRYGVPSGFGPEGAPFTGTITPAPPPPAHPDPPRAADPKPQIIRVKVGGVVRPPQIIREVRPAYPPLARQARISGTVKLEAVIATDGSVQALKVTGGHPLLAPAAVEAVRQWRYQPTTLNGDPVEVTLVIDVHFTLSH